MGLFWSEFLKHTCTFIFIKLRGDIVWDMKENKMSFPSSFQIILQNEEGFWSFLSFLLIYIFSGRSKTYCLKLCLVSIFILHIFYLMIHLMTVRVLSGCMQWSSPQGVKGHGERDFWNEYWDVFKQKRVLFVGWEEYFLELWICCSLAVPQLSSLACHGLCDWRSNEIWKYSRSKQLINCRLCASLNNAVKSSRILPCPAWDEDAFSTICTQYLLLACELLDSPLGYQIAVSHIFVTAVHFFLNHEPKAQS